MPKGTILVPLQLFAALAELILDRFPPRFYFPLNTDPQFGRYVNTGILFFKGLRNICRIGRIAVHKPHWKEVG